jgi:RimJ/RimL family protein N-acetyltransferase
MKVEFKQLKSSSPEIAGILDKWGNDPGLIPYIRPNPTEADLEEHQPVTVKLLEQRLQHHQIYLIYANGQLVGEMDYQVDPPHLFKKVTGTAWIGINIGEEIARGKGVGVDAMHFLEQQARANGVKRIELGVFEFNHRAIKLYTKMGYREIGRINDFTFWQGKLWQDIRMEKYLT